MRHVGPTTLCRVAVSVHVELDHSARYVTNSVGFVERSFWTLPFRSQGQLLLFVFVSKELLLLLLLLLTSMHAAKRKGCNGSCCLVCMRTSKASAEVREGREGYPKQ